jgi:outer membrane immunogenic protein
MRKLLAASTLLFISGGYALAADAVVDEVVIVEETFNWSGVYVGVQGGYGWGETSLTSPDDPLAPPLDIDLDGGFGGGHLAARRQFDSFTVGAEAEINYSGIDGSTLSSDIKWFGSVNAEVGLPIDRILIYATAGVAFADIDYSFTPDMAAAPIPDRDDSAVGWTAGVGVDYAVTDNVIVGARYRYYDFGDASFAAVEVPPVTYLARDYETDLHTIALKAAYKF